jgi:hypothetical protein
MNKEQVNELNQEQVNEVNQEQVNELNKEQINEIQEKINKIKRKSQKELNEIELDKNIIKEFIETNTIKSNLNNDTISMNDLYKSFYEWIVIKYPDNNIVIQRKFTRILKEIDIVNYKSNISNLNGTSGITNILIIN